MDFHRQHNLELRLAWLRLNQQLPMMTIGNDIVRNVQAQACALAGRLCRKERLEDPRTDRLGYARTIICDLDDHIVILCIGPQTDLASTIHRIDGIIDDIRPHLI